MGTFCVNFHVKSESRKSVTKVLKTLINTRAYVSSSRDGWISVFEERTSLQEEEEIRRLGQELSSHLESVVFGFLVHDSDVLHYWLFEEGRVHDEYDSWPNYFRPVPEATAQRLQGNPDVLLKFCRSGTTRETLQGLLGQGPKAFGEMAEGKLAKLATLLGIDPLRRLWTSAPLSKETLALMKSMPNWFQAPVPVSMGEPETSAMSYLLASISAGSRFAKCMRRGGRTLRALSSAP